ncbi:hypothetical protein BOX15_Mlig030791g2 [Macrostomum lignano]|uniref:Valine--tRNA ligase n=1 Tax=Macrostomum lignano TaxID=282301 RepID=A0A267E400_9PLAT|nr:hypothetical protein BOX15_Mlig030791g2 [Macrostomum lignano]
MADKEKADKKKQKKEAEKAAKLAKFQAKKQLEEQQKAAAAAADGQKQSKKKKAGKPEKPAGPAEYKWEHEPGQRKNTACPLPEAYEPRYVESAWYEWWESKGFFKPEYQQPDFTKPNPRGIFMMVIPPPNVTAGLHIGHALTSAIEDTLTRWHRMRGETTLWNPGCDHAGIATQVVVEKKLMRERGLTRHDLGREAFEQEIWRYRNEKGDRIYYQLRHLGCSCDWSRARFTMEPKMSRAVIEAFVRMHGMGLMYRANRLVNWSCTLRSAISDIEVEKKELTGRKALHVPGYEQPIEFGVLTHFAYPLADSDEKIVVATTRPETMLGDTAVAVHPEDPRYKHMHDRRIVHPFFPDREMRVVADSFVEREFGTGAVKITPAHDANDFECGIRNNLAFITVIGEDGRIADNCGEFSGLPRFDARQRVVDALKAKGLWIGEQDNPMVVPICSRSKDVIEPLIKPQWYVRCEGMAKRALDAVESGELQLIPEYHNRVWREWLSNCRDWCISRQLWWGHQVPAWLPLIDGKPAGGCDPNSGDSWLIGRNHDEAMAQARAKWPKEAAEGRLTLKQDPDVLDTWFSSQLFPFSVFDWPDQTLELSTFYPGTLLETGHDILFFWVARMVMAGLTLMDKLPFRYVYLHAIVRDSHGQKMSKSKGNVIDPMDVINGITLESLHAQLEDSNLDRREIDRARQCQKEDYPNGIPECGTDALRFALCAYSAQGRDINLDVLRVQGYRFFCNKMWQAVRYVLMCLGDSFQLPETRLPHRIGSSLDQWILSRLTYTVRAIDKGLEAYDFQSATTACYNFWLYDFCDVYLEYSKLALKDPEYDADLIRHTLYICCDTGLRLAHPFMPFITEELWQRLPRHPPTPLFSEPSLCVAEFPSIGEFHCYRKEHCETEVDQLIKIIKAVRSLRGEYQLTGRQRTRAILVTADSELAALVQREQKPLCSLSNCSIIECSSSRPTEACAMNTLNDRVELHLVLAGIVDLAKEAARLASRLDTLDKQVAKLREQLDAPGSASMPEAVRAANRDKLEKLLTERAKLAESAVVSGGSGGIKQLIRLSNSKSAYLLTEAAKCIANLLGNGQKITTVQVADKQTRDRLINCNNMPNGNAEFVATFDSSNPNDAIFDLIGLCHRLQPGVHCARDQWISLAISRLLPAVVAMATNSRHSSIGRCQFVDFARMLNGYLATRTFLVGESLSAADAAVASLLQQVSSDVAVTTLTEFGNVRRYLDLMKHREPLA